MKAVLARINTFSWLRVMGGGANLSPKRLFREKPLIAWLLVISILAVVYVRVLEPTINYLANAEKETQRLRKDIDENQALLVRTQDKLAGLAKSRKDLWSLTSPKQGVGGDQKLINIVHQVAQAAGLSQVQISATNSQTKSKLVRMRFGLTAIGNQAQLLVFIQGLSSKPDKLFVTEVDLKVDSANPSGNLQTKVMMETFQRKEHHQ